MVTLLELLVIRFGADVAGGLGLSLLDLDFVAASGSCDGEAEASSFGPPLSLDDLRGCIGSSTSTVLKMDRQKSVTYFGLLV